MSGLPWDHSSNSAALWRGFSSVDNSSTTTLDEDGGALAGGFGEGLRIEPRCFGGFFGTGGEQATGQKDQGRAERIGIHVR